MPKLKILRKKEDAQKTHQLSLKLSQVEYDTLVGKALKYTDGNLSEWIRYASTVLEPRKEDLEK